MKVFNAFDASPTGGKWGKVGEEVYNDLVLSFDEFELLRVTAGRLSKLSLEDFPQWGKVGEGWGKTLDMVFRVPQCFPHFLPQGEGS